MPSVETRSRSLVISPIMVQKSPDPQDNLVPPIVDLPLRNNAWIFRLDYLLYGPDVSQRQTYVPAPGSLEIFRAPRCLRQIVLAMLRPTPRCPDFVLKNGSSARSRTWGAMPGPESRISTMAR